jgi:hypothetical protein
MKKLLILSLTLTWSVFALSQNVINKNTSYFNKVSVSPKINLQLIKGDKESVRINYSGISSDKINIEVVNGQLRIYLDDARIVDKRKRVDSEEYGNSKVSIYEQANITAYVTYRDLKQLEMRGEEELVCEDPISSDKFKLQIYGKADVVITSIKAKKFKAAIYGENKIKIDSGEATHQVYRLFGENKIDTRGLTSETVSVRTYGEGKLRLNANNEVHVIAFGEPIVNVSGEANINKGLIIGKANIDKFD